VNFPGPDDRLALVRRLTACDPTWLVWKGADNVVGGVGDIDSAAAKPAWPQLADAQRAWAEERGLGPTIVCRHAPGTQVMVTCVAGAPLRLFQVDVYERAAGVASAAALAGAAVDDAAGFRRLRPGAEGLLLVLAAARSRRRTVATASRVSDDDAGAEQLAARLGAAGAAALALRRAEPRARLRLELELLRQAALHPGRRAAWVRFRLGRGADCPLLTALDAGRTVHGDAADWLERTVALH